MVTRNLGIEETARRVLIHKKLLERDDFPPVLTDRQLAGLLWFAVGGNIGAISRTKLIANCSAALNPRNDIASKLKQYLFESDPMKAESFTALMRDQRARRSLMHETLGFTIGVTRDNADYLLERMRVATAEEIQRESAQRESQLRADYNERVSQLAETHKNEIQGVRTELLETSVAKAEVEAEKERQIAERDAKIDNLEESVARLNSRVLEEENDKITAALGFANRARKRLRVLFVALYAALTLVVLTAEPGGVFSTGLSLCLAVLGFWFVTNYVMDGLLQYCWWQHFRGDARKRLATALIDRFDINAAEGTATRKVPAAETALQALRQTQSVT